MKTHLITWLLAGFICSTLSIWGQASKSDTPFRILESAPNEKISKIMQQALEYEDLHAIAVWAIELNEFDWRSKKEVKFVLPMERPLRATFQLGLLDQPKVDQYTWLGQPIESSAGNIAFAVNVEGWGASIQIGMEHFTMVSVEGKRGILIRHSNEYKEKDLCGDFEAAHDLNPLFDPGTVIPSFTNTIDYCATDNDCPDECDNIHILLVTTEEAETYFSFPFTFSLTTVLHISTSRINQALQISGLTNKSVSYSVRSYPYSFISGGPITTDLANMTTNLFFQGSLNTYNADVLFLITYEGYPPIGGAGAGAAFLGPDATKPFGIVEAPQLGKPTFLLAHEFGHLLGARHHRNDLPINIGTCEHGYRYNNGVAFSTVMAYSNGLPNILYYSNPNKSFSGIPTGDANNNNAKWISQSFCEVAGFKDDYCLTLQQGPDDTYDADVWNNKPNNNYGHRESINVYAW